MDNDECEGCAGPYGCVCYELDLYDCATCHDEGCYSCEGDY